MTSLNWPPWTCLCRVSVGQSSKEDLLVVWSLALRLGFGKGRGRKVVRMGSHRTAYADCSGPSISTSHTCRLDPPSPSVTFMPAGGELVTSASSCQQRVSYVFFCRCCCYRENKTRSVG